MRSALGLQRAVLIEEIELNAKSRDDIPTLLIGFQAIYTSEAAQTERMGILDKHILPARGF